LLPFKVLFLHCEAGKGKTKLTKVKMHHGSILASIHFAQITKQQDLATEQDREFSTNFLPVPSPWQQPSA
jgi:hypothetical protein